MSIITRFFSKSAAITSDMIQAEIERAEGEIVTLHSKLAVARSGIMLLSDSEHQAVEQSSAVTKRAIDRLDMRIAYLQSELPAVLAAEEAAQAAAKDEALRKHAGECRKANAKEAKVLLTSYAEHANAIAEITAKLKAITDETTAVNVALARNPVADNVVHYDTLHRKHPDREATGSIYFRPGHYEDSLENGGAPAAGIRRDVHLAALIENMRTPSKIGGDKRRTEPGRMASASQCARRSTTTLSSTFASGSP